MIAAIAVLGLSSPASASQITASGIRGQWRVYKAELANPEGVQAYGDVQLRALAGSRLLIGRNDARWIISSGRMELREHESFFEVCGRPVIEDIGDDYFKMRCDGKDVFAPGLTLLSDGSLLILWWDGVNIYLRKQR